MTKKNKIKDTRLITVTNVAFIHTLGISGPIHTPIEVATQMVYKTVSANYNVFQFDPISKNNVKLTLENFNDPFSKIKFDSIEVEHPEILEIGIEEKRIETEKRMQMTETDNVEEYTNETSSEEEVETATEKEAESISEEVIITDNEKPMLNKSGKKKKNNNK